MQVCVFYHGGQTTVYSRRTNTYRNVYFVKKPEKAAVSCFSSAVLHARLRKHSPKTVHVPMRLPEKKLQFFRRETSRSMECM